VLTVEQKNWMGSALTLRNSNTQWCKVIKVYKSLQKLQSNKVTDVKHRRPKAMTRMLLWRCEDDVMMMTTTTMSKFDSCFLCVISPDNSLINAKRGTVTLYI